MIKIKCNNPSILIKSKKYFEYFVTNSISYQARVKFHSFYLKFIGFKPILQEEFFRHSAESSNKINSFVKSYFLSFLFLNHIIDPLVSDKFLAIGIKLTLTPLILNQMSQNSFTNGLTEALLGPGLTYCLIHNMPNQYSILTLHLSKCIIRSIAVRLLGLSNKEAILKLFRFLPGIVLAGIIRGFIMYFADMSLQKYSLSDNDIFHWSMIVKFIFEPQVKKCENFFI